MASSCPQFFKLLLQRNLEEGKLMIPKQFVKEYGKFLSSSVCLKLPDGMKWKVGLTTASNGAVWLQKGWHHFTQHYSLEFGSLLVFKLDGSSTFQTTVFDPTGVETQYRSNFKQQIKDIKHSDSDCDVRRKRKKASAHAHGHSRKKPRVCNEDSFSVKAEPEDEGCEPCLKKRFSGFIVHMKPSYVRGRFNMIIPKDSAKKYLSENFGMIKLQTVNGKSWPLVYKWSRQNVAYISSGWKTFAQKNHLKKGDVGAFEFVRKDTFSFKLQHAPSPSKTVRNRPVFEVHISYRKAVLYIPTLFAKEHLSKEMHFAKLRVGKKRWIVTIKQYYNSVRFSAGWSTFHGDNALEDGDTCLFEMVNDSRKCVFQVTIFKNV